MIETDIANRLIAKGLATSGQCYVNWYPANPDDIVSLFVYQGGPIERTHDSSGNANPFLQVRVRSKSATTAREKIQKILNNLDGLTNTTVGASFILNISAIGSGPTMIGRDGNDRTEYTMNFDILVRR